MANLVERLAIIITGDSSSATASMDSVEVASGKVQVALARQDVAQAKAAGSSEELAAAQARLAEAQNALGVEKATAGLASAQANLDKVTAATAKAGQEMSALDVAAGKVVDALGPVGIAAAAVGAGFGALKIVNQFSAATEAVRKFGLISGSSAEDSSRLVYAMSQLGVDSDIAGTAFFRLAHNLEGGKDKLSQFGVSVAQTSNGTIDLSQTVLNIAEAMQKAGPGAEADAIAFAAFGRQAAQLTPLLQQGRDGITAFYAAAASHGLVFDQKEIDKGYAYTIATRDLGEAFRGLTINIASGVVPALTQFETGLSVIFDGIQRVSKDVPFLFEGFHLLNEALGLNKTSTDSAAEAALAQADAAKVDQAAIQAQADAVKAITKANDDYISQLNTVTSAQKSEESAQRSVVTAQRSEQSAQDALTKLRQQGAVDANAVASAEANLASASKAVTTAQKQEATAAQNVADAQQAVLDAQTALQKVEEGSSPEDIERAQLAASKAQRDITRANLGVSSSLDAINNLITVGVVGAGQQIATADKQVSAQLDLADAQDQVKIAGLDAQDAQQKLTDTLNAGKPGSDTYKAAQDKLTQTQKDLATAIDNEATAQQNVIDKQSALADADAKLREAQKGDPDFNAKLAAAQQAVADAHQNTVDQINAEKDANEALNIAEGKLVTDRIARAAQQPTIPPGTQGPFLDPKYASPPAAGRTAVINGQTVQLQPFNPTGVTITGDLHLNVGGTALATVTQDELAAAARRNGLS